MDRRLRRRLPMRPTQRHLSGMLPRPTPATGLVPADSARSVTAWIAVRRRLRELVTVTAVRLVHRPRLQFLPDTLRVGAATSLTMPREHARILAYKRLRLSHAGSAAPPALSVAVRVRGHVLVAAWAMRLLRVAILPRHWALPAPPDVLDQGALIKVLRVDARALAAQVVERESIIERPGEKLVDHAVGHAMPAPVLDPAVAGPILSAGPEPAPVVIHDNSLSDVSEHAYELHVPLGGGPMDHRPELSLSRVHTSTLPLTSDVALVVTRKEYYAVL